MACCRGDKNHLLCARRDSYTVKKTKILDLFSAGEEKRWISSRTFDIAWAQHALHLPPFHVGPTIQIHTPISQSSSESSPLQEINQARASKKYSQLVNPSLIYRAEDCVNVNQVVIHKLRRASQTKTKTKQVPKIPS